MIGKLIFLLAVVIVLSTGLYFADQLIYQNKVESLYSHVLSNFSEIRGYEVDKNRVPIHVVSRQWVLDRWGAEKVEESVPQYLVDEELFLKTLLLVDDNFSYYVRKNQEVGGFLAFSWKGEVYVVKEHFDPEQPGSGEALAHEVEHIIQEEYYELEDDGTYDGKKAVGAIIEGDAVLAGKLYFMKNLTDSEPLYEIHEDNALNFLYMFPYNNGISYLSKIYLESGYEGIDSVLKDPPVTTKQILHSNRENSGFESVSNDLFNGELVREDRLGELMVFTFLAAHIDDDKARIAASGWNGDSYVLYRGSEGSESSGFKWQWKIAWESENDAEEFLDAFDSMMYNLSLNGADFWEIQHKYLPQKIWASTSGNVVVIYGESADSMSK